MPNIDINSDAIIVNGESVDREYAWGIVQSNADSVSYLFDRGMKPEQVSPYALYSYYVDYYHTQVYTGGHAQFIWNSRWDDVAIRLLRQGLIDMRAVKQREIFEECASYVSSLGQEGLQTYLSRPWSPIPELGALDDRTYRLADADSLPVINSSWLRSHPKLLPLSDEDVVVELSKRVARHRASTINERLALVRKMNFRSSIAAMMRPLRWR